MKKVYCINNECPFKSCKRHLTHCRAKKRKVWVANYDGICSKYIGWLVKKVWEDNNSWNAKN